MDSSTLHIACSTLSLIRVRVEERLLIWRETTDVGKGKRRMSPEDQRSSGFVFLGLSLGL